MARVPLGGAQELAGGAGLVGLSLLAPRRLSLFSILGFGGEHADFSFARERGSQCPALGPVDLSSPVMVGMELWLQRNVARRGRGHLLLQKCLWGRKGWYFQSLHLI